MRALLSWSSSLFRASRIAVGVAPPEEYVHAAKGLLSQDRGVAALGLLGRGAARFPGNYSLQLEFAFALKRQGDADGALSAFLDAAVADPAAIAPHIHMAQLFAEEKNWDAVIESCRAALALNPTNSEMRRQLCAAESNKTTPSPAVGAKFDRTAIDAGLDLFSDTYQEAREKFLAAAKALNVSVRSYMNPARGPDGESLWTDALVLGEGNAKKVLVANSATHGAEGFCGAGALTGWLRGPDPLPPEDVRLVLVHAINPYGFAWLRRVNEDNVDLNRNFLSDYANPPANTGYADLHTALVTAGGNDADWSGARRALTSYAEKHGLFEMQAVLSRGQYLHPDGLFYGGTGPTWSNRTFRAILNEMVGGAEHVAFVDFHTGLGPFGHAELISKCALDSCEFSRLRGWFGPAVKTSAAGESTSPMLSGLIANAIRDLKPSGTVTAVTAEFGTYPLWDVMRVLQKDNWLHVRGRFDSEDGLEIKRDLKECFYPDRADWRELVLVRSRQLIEAGLSGLRDL